jgi:capsular exopolysaccharide synthesis family protein
LSKIYDALRKAEREKHKQGKARKGRPKGTKIDSSLNAMLLEGMDEKFKRSLMTLRNSIESEIKENDTHVIVFTSAVKGEGKTTVLASFARVLAIGYSGKILLVDCSVRNPLLHRLFGVENEKGIIDYLSGQAEVPQIIKKLDIGCLDLVTAGHAIDIDITMPLFNSERMAFFIREMAEAYEYVLIDTSAILEAPETPIISSYADGVVMVVQIERTRREAIKRAIVMVEKLDGKFIGTVLNRKKYHIPEFIYRRV